MKRILVTGLRSYIGSSLASWLSGHPNRYEVNQISVRDDSWKTLSFSGYDVVVHLAAIVHRKVKDASCYYLVNRDLTVELAEKARREGVKQFVFLSTMGVYGLENGYIDELTEPNPKSHYARSKYEAEQRLSVLGCDTFRIATVRPPIVYGPGCPGNYRRLINMAMRFPFFPDISNKRSMIYIDHLCEFIRILIDREEAGLFFPQNKEYVNTVDMVDTALKYHNIKLKRIKKINGIVALAGQFSQTASKVFGTMVYDKRLPGGPYAFDYETVSFEESIRRAESKGDKVGQ